MILGNDLVIAIELGGAEDGTPSWGSPTTISCAIREYRNSASSVTVDTTTRCATLTTAKGVRTTHTITMTLDVPDSGTPYIPLGVNTYVRVAEDLIAAASTTTYVCVVRQNELSAPVDARQAQSVTLEVQSIA